MTIEVKQDLLKINVTASQNNNDVILQPVIGIPSSVVVGGTVQESFAATSNQTVFNLTGTPTNITVFSGRTLSLPGVDYSYSNGVITFTSGKATGTIVTVLIY